MKSSVALFFLFLLFAACTDNENHTVAVLDTGSVEGKYVGYRTQSLGLSKPTDSTRVVLEVKKISPDQVEILQTSPNEFRYLVTLNNNRFTYDRGQAESLCGVVNITGEGYFRAGNLYLLETTRCTKNTSSPSSFIQLRAVKQ